jgi:hypothetical protein
MNFKKFSKLFNFLQTARGLFRFAELFEINSIHFSEALQSSTVFCAG